MTNCAGFWLNAGWEQRTESKAISRWFVAWKDTGNNEIAGAVAGYCGGGSFLVERFYAQLEGENLNSLWIDYEDRISGNEINFSELDEKILSSCEDALDCIWEWNNHDHWGETDEVVLLNDKKHQLSAKADMLYFSTKKVPYLHMICEKAGLTAAPA